MKCGGCKGILTPKEQEEMVGSLCIECYINVCERDAKKRETEEQFQLEEEERAWGMS